MGAFNRSAIVTVVERRSRLLLLGELPDGHGAQQVYDCLRGLCADLPDVARRTITWDQGREMADWAQLEVDADVEVYFCDPHSPWQRPSNEHMNGLLRQYFPKGTDLGLVSRAELRAVAAEMNGRPARSSAGAPLQRSTLTSLQPPLDRAHRFAGQPMDAGAVAQAGSKYLWGLRRGVGERGMNRIVIVSTEDAGAMFSCESLIDAVRMLPERINHSD